VRSNTTPVDLCTKGSAEKARARNYLALACAGPPGKRE